MTTHDLPVTTGVNTFTFTSHERSASYSSCIQLQTSSHSPSTNDLPNTPIIIDHCIHLNASSQSQARNNNLPKCSKNVYNCKQPVTANIIYICKNLHIHKLLLVTATIAYICIQLQTSSHSLATNKLPSTTTIVYISKHLRIH